MALLTKATSANRIILQAPTERYTQLIINGQWSWVYPLNVTNFLYCAYEYHRHLECSYKYVGMEYNSAKEEADRIRDLLTYDTYASDWDASVGDFVDYKSGRDILGTVEVVKNVGHLYDIVVSIQESDTHLRKNPDEPLSQVFANERLRTYII